MEQKEGYVQSLGICRKLFEIIAKSLAAQTCKTVTLGSPTHGTFAGVPPQTCPVSSSGQKACPGQQQPEKAEMEEVIEVEISVPETRSIPLSEDTHVGNAGTAEAGEMEPEESKGIKKAVSFHDEVAKIQPAKRKKKKFTKRTRSSEKSGSTEHEDDHEEHLPLKSILKVGSDLSLASNPA